MVLRSPPALSSGGLEEVFGRGTEEGLRRIPERKGRREEGGDRREEKQAMIK